MLREYFTGLLRDPNFRRSVDSVLYWLVYQDCLPIVETVIDLPAYSDFQLSVETLSNGPVYPDCIPSVDAVFYWLFYRDFRPSVETVFEWPVYRDCQPAACLNSPSGGQLPWPNGLL